MEEVNSALKEALKDLKVSPGGSLDLAQPVRCSECNDSRIVPVPSSIGTGYTQCECYYLDLLDNVDRKLPDSIRPDLAGKRLAVGRPYRMFPPSKDKSKQIQPSDYVALNGHSKDRQKKLLAKLAETPINGFALHGPTGTGKTFLLYALAKEAIYAGRVVIMKKTSAILDAMRQGEARSGDGEDQSIGTLRQSLSVSGGKKVHLMLDEMEEIPSTDFASRKLFELIDFCYDHNESVTLSIATNLSPQAFSNVFGPAMTRRVTFLCSQAITVN